jgi:hypothetical protein
MRVNNPAPRRIMDSTNLTKPQCLPECDRQRRMFGRGAKNDVPGVGRADGVEDAAVGKKANTGEGCNIGTSAAT